MKPLLIIPPAPARWSAMQDLLKTEGSASIADVQQRLCTGVEGAEDAFAVIASGGQFLACACVNKKGDVGVFGHAFTRVEHRRHGHARKLAEATLSWFDMTGGKWLFMSTTAEIDESVYRKFGFEPIRRAIWAPFDRLTMLRTAPNVPPDPMSAATGPLRIQDVMRADWPEIVTFLQYRLGPDPRVPLSESAVTAPVFALDLIQHLEKGACRLIGAYQGPRMLGLATIAIDQPGPRTYAMLMPHADSPPELRQAALDFARERNYTDVDFPMETLVRTGTPQPIQSAPPGQG